MSLEGSGPAERVLACCKSEHCDSPLPRIGIHDRSPDRFKFFSEFIHSARCEPISLNTSPFSAESHFAAALIAIGDAGPDDEDLQAIRHLKRCTQVVVAYGYGTNDWPIAAKCLPLLAGATKLLDSSDPKFAHFALSLVHEAAQMEADASASRQEIFLAMRQHGIVGSSVGIVETFKSAIRFSELSDLPVLITGDSGTGKELMAKAIAKMDPKRRLGPFVTVNCAAVAPALIESEFFGHRRGAFTGAQRDRKGLIRAAEGGVLFLDEIGELETGLQAKLLRVLQEGRVLSVGNEDEVPVNVRFIAATNQTLEPLIAERKFRRDLFHRLRVLSVHIPPLRDRGLDITQLVEFFLQKHRSLHRHTISGVNADFLKALHQLEFPGNVRQLENLVRQAIVNHKGCGELDLNDLPTEILTHLSLPVETSFVRTIVRLKTTVGSPSTSMNEWVKQVLDRSEWNLSKAMCECERSLFDAALERTRGNRSEAARLLGITARSVYNKLRKFDTAEGPRP